MTSDNTMNCVECHMDTQHYKQSFIRYLSPVLVLHFQRFDDFTRQKLTSFVDCPEELDMEKFMPMAGKYRLVSVINHRGNIDFGHYTAHIRIGENWYHFNDSRVELVGSSLRLDATAYVLTYTRL